jgi:hypothetical protein
MFSFKDKRKNCKISSRAAMVYFVIILWVIFGVIISIYQPKGANGELLEKVSFSSMAIYFVALTGFVGAFIYGATIKPDHEATPIFLSGRTDKRELLIYICILLWTILGLWGIFKNVPLDEIGAYFGALTPFVGGYILGETTRSSRATNIELEKTEG